MIWKVTFTAKVLHKLLDLPKSVQKKFSVVTDILEKSPDPRSHPSLCKIRDCKNLYRIKLTKKYRAFYKYDSIHVTVIDIRKRDKDTYKPEYIGKISCEEDIAPIWDIEEEEALTTTGKVEPWIAEDQLECWNIPERYWQSLVEIKTNDDDHLLEALEQISESYIRDKILDNLLPSTDKLEELEDLAEYQISGNELEAYISGEIEITDLTFVLSEEQQKILDLDRDKPILVKGGPGTGKSILALHFAVKMAKEVTRSEKVLLATHNPSLVKWLKDHIKPLVKDHFLSNELIDIKTTQEMGIDIYKKHYGSPKLSNRDMDLFYLKSVIGEYEDSHPNTRIPFGKKIEFLLDEFRFFIESEPDIRTKESYINLRQRKIRKRDCQVIYGLYEKWKEAIRSGGLMTIEQVFKKTLSIPVDKMEQYNSLVIDEAQDLSPVALKLLVSICKEPRNIVFFADMDQSLYQRFHDWNYLSASVGHNVEKKELLRSFRNTRQIIKANMQILSDTIHGIYPSEVGEKPKVILTTNSNQEASIIKHFFEEASKRFRLPLSRCSVVLVPSEVYGEVIANELTNLGLVSKYVNSDHVSTEDGHLRVLTMNNSKGFEFPFVAVVGLKEGQLPTESLPSMPDKDKRDLLKKEKNSFYVACSRAMKALLVCGSQAKPSRFIKPLLSNKFWLYKGHGL